MVGKRLAALALLSAAIAFNVLAQQTPPAGSQIPRTPDSTAVPGAPTATLKVRVNQVLVPVVVTDKGGHNVVGLKAGDFEVFENGVEQKLSAFQTEDERPPDFIPPVSLDVTKPGTEPAPVLPSAARPPLRRTYMVCLDTINSSFENFSYVRSALRKLFKRERGADSLYAILTLGRNVKVVQDLTTDSSAVLDAVGSKELTRAILQSEATNMKHQANQLTMMLLDYCQSCPCNGAAAATGRTSTGGENVCEGKLQQIEMWAGATAEERSALTRAFLQNLRLLVDRIGQTPGKRTIVFVSDGFNTHPGRDLFGLIAAYTRNYSVLMNNSINDAEPQIQDILRVAWAHDVAFYTLDSRGLTGPGGGSFDASEEVLFSRTVLVLPEIQQQREMTTLENQAPLAELAESTGGIFYRNNNDLFRGMHQAFADGREYYLLAYVPTNLSTDGKYREIKVSVKGKYLLVRAKHGYWAPTQ
jgi:VWFA-related protein